MNISKRDFLIQGLCGAGLLGLRAMATGLPISFLANPRSAFADGNVPLCASKTKAQYLILCTSGSGDPVNANVPGTYDFPDIVHAADPSMMATTFTLGQKQVKGAQVWSTLPPWVLARTCFFHHATYTNSHPNESKVLRLMGATVKQEAVPSIYAKYLAGCLGTVQTEPLTLGGGSVVTFEGRALPQIAPTSIRQVLAHPQGPLGNLQKLRDQSLNEINAVLKDGATSAQSAFVDELVSSRQQVRAISDNLLSTLDGITSDKADGQIAAAVTLIHMNIAPVMVISIPFGGDNHVDPDLMKNEVPQTQAGVQYITDLMMALQQAGLQDRVTFGLLNVFGRTLKSQGLVGRTHWANHHAGLLIGSGVRAGVVGALAPMNGDYGATPIDSRTGNGTPGGGDIPFNETLESYAKTLGAALGTPEDYLNTNITKGKVVTAALNT